MVALTGCCATRKTACHGCHEAMKEADGVSQRTTLEPKSLIHVIRIEKNSDGACIRRVRTTVTGRVPRATLLPSPRVFKQVDTGIQRL